MNRAILQAKFAYFSKFNYWSLLFVISYRIGLNYNIQYVRDFGVNINMLREFFVIFII